MLDIHDLQSLLMDSQAKAQEWRAEFDALFNEPVILAGQVMEYLGADEAGRAQMKAADPERHAKIERQAKRLRQMTGGMSYAGR